jgi:hypothetical protein
MLFWVAAQQLVDGVLYVLSRNPVTRKYTSLLIRVLGEPAGVSLSDRVHAAPPHPHAHAACPRT